MELEKMSNSEATLKLRDIARGITLPDFKLFYKAVRVKRS